MLGCRFEFFPALVDLKMKKFVLYLMMIVVYH